MSLLSAWPKVYSTTSISHIKWRFTNLFETKDRTSDKFRIDNTEFFLNLSRLGSKGNYEFVLKLQESREAHNMPLTTSTFIEGIYRDEQFQQTTKIIGSALTEGHIIWRETQKNLEYKKDYLKETTAYGDVLTLTCKIELHIEKEEREEKVKIEASDQEATEADSEPRYECLEVLSSDFKKFFYSSDTDVCLRNGHKKHFGHRSILRARSERLDKLLRIRREGDIIYDVDIEPEILSSFVYFVYCGTLPECSFEETIMLFNAGMDYNVEGLSKICLIFLLKNLAGNDVDVYSVLKLIERYEDIPEEAKMEFTFFIRENEEEFFIGKRWEQFIAEYPTAGQLVYNISG